MATTNVAQFNLPPSPYELEREKLAKRRAAAEALAARAQQPLGPGVSAGQFFVPTSAMNALGQVLSSYLTQRGVDRADKAFDKSVVGERKSFEEDVRRYMELMQGKEGTPGTPEQPIMAQIGGQPSNIQNVETFPYAGSGEPPATAPVEVKPIDISRKSPGEALPIPQLGQVGVQSGTPGTPAVPPNSKAAMAHALASKHGFLNQIAALQLLQSQGQGGEEFGTTPFVDKHGRVHLVGKQGTMKETGLEGVSKEGRVNKSLPDNWHDVASRLGFARKPDDPAGMVRVPDADGKPMLAQMQFENGQLIGVEPLDKRDRINVNQTTGFPREMEKVTAGLVEGTMKPLMQAAATAKNDTMVIKQAEELLAQGVKTGSFADFRARFDMFAQTMGWKSDDPRVSNTLMFQGQLGNRVLQSISKLGAGTGISNADVIFMQKVVAGQDLDEAGFKRFFRISRAQNEWSSQQYGNALKLYRGIEGVPGSAVNLLEGTSHLPTAAPQPLPEDGPSAPLSPTERAELQRLRDKYGR